LHSWVERVKAQGLGLMVVEPEEAVPVAKVV
jgi:hypothetical protein